MPVQLQIDGGEQYLPYAKQRLAVLEDQLLRQGLRTGTRRYRLDEAEIEVHVSIPVDVASGKPRRETAQNRIRIEGGRKTGAIFLFDNSTFILARASRLALSTNGDPVFVTPGVTPLGTGLALAGYEPWESGDREPRDARELSPKDKRGLVRALDDVPVGSAGHFFRSSVISVGGEVVELSVTTSLAHAVLVDRKLNLLYYDQEKLIHLNGQDVEDWYRGATTFPTSRVYGLLEVLDAEGFVVYPPGEAPAPGAQILNNATTTDQKQTVEVATTAPGYGLVAVVQDVTMTRTRNQQVSQTPGFESPFHQRFAVQEDVAISVARSESYRVYLGATGELEIEALGMEPVYRRHQVTFPASSLDPPGPANATTSTVTEELLARSAPVRQPSGGSETAVLDGRSRSHNGLSGSVAYQGRTFFATTSNLLEIYRGALVRGITSDGGPYQTFFYGEELPPGIRLDVVSPFSTNLVIPFSPQQRFTEMIDSVTDIQFGIGGAAVIIQSYAGTRDDEEWRAKSPLGLSENLLGHVRYGRTLAVDQQPWSLLVLYWPNATPEKAGLCILGLPFGNYQSFVDTLASAIAAKRAGQPYEALLEQAEALLAYKVNNFASWELIAKFPSLGAYCIAT